MKYDCSKCESSFECKMTLACREENDNLETILWHPYPQEKPRRKGVYLVTLDWTSDEKKVWAMRYDKEVPFGREVIAWSEMPKPYEEIHQ